ncbi:MAG: enoyl-[acyl-carrier-protein] reductase [Sandaracinaceae bacterium]|nr:enoyl-[acyl-carrier-protein] reductase [Sandaracinaceae bacterium]
MLKIDLKGKRAFVAGVADDGGFGWAIAKQLAEAGASVCVGTWPPALGIFETLLRRGKLDESSKLSDGSKLEFERVLALDADYDRLELVPEEVRDSRRYKERGDFSIEGAAKALEADFGSPCVDIVVHSLANGPEVKKPLLETSRSGYLAAVGASAYSYVSLVQRFGPLMRPGGAFLSLSYLAAERAVPGYGGGMSSAKAALESDTKALAFEVGRKWGHRVNAISAGPYASRAASAIGLIGKMIEHYEVAAPLPERLTAEEVGNTAAFLCSPLASGITGTLVHVDKGYHAMAVPGDLLIRAQAER